MINKKLLILSFLMFVAFLTVCVYADSKEKNFVTVLNGANFESEAGKNSYSFIGQPVVFATKEEKDTTSQSAFASVFYITQSSDIHFTNITTSTEPFKDIQVDLEVTIISSSTAPNDKGDIDKVRYRVWEGEDVDWNNYEISPEVSYEGSVSGKKVNFKQTVILSAGQEVNFFKVYAQLKDGSKRWSEAYMVRLVPGLSSGIKIISPDGISKTATIDPQVETTSLRLTTATITLTNEDTGEEVYSVVLDTTTNASLNMYNEGKIYYLHSKFIPKYNEYAQKSLPTTLTNNTEYKLSIIVNDKEETVTFKALSGGVADILTYPSPFNPKKEKIKIRYLLADERKVTIRLYDKAGKVVCKLVDGETRSAGTNEEEWDGRNYAGETLATGAYIVEIIAGSDRRYTALAIVGK